MAKFQTARDLDLDLGSAHIAYRHASVIDLYLQETFCGRLLTANFKVT